MGFLTFNMHKAGRDIPTYNFDAPVGLICKIPLTHMEVCGRKVTKYEGGQVRWIVLGLNKPKTISCCCYYSFCMQTTRVHLVFENISNSFKHLTFKLQINPWVYEAFSRYTSNKHPWTLFCVKFNWKWNTVELFISCSSVLRATVCHFYKEYVF